MSELGSKGIVPLHGQRSVKGWLTVTGVNPDQWERIAGVIRDAQNGGSAEEVTELLSERCGVDPSQIRYYDALLINAFDKQKVTSFLRWRGWGGEIRFFRKFAPVPNPRMMTVHPWFRGQSEQD